MEEKPYFSLGQIVLSRGVADKSEKDDMFREFVDTCLHRYQTCDWGDTHEEACIANAFSVTFGDRRILARYIFGRSTTIWITTEADRSATTILFPDEY